MTDFQFDITDEITEGPTLQQEDTRTWSGVDEYINPVDEPEIPEEKYDTPDASFIKTQARPRGAIAYQKKIHNAIAKPAFQITVQNPATVADAAAILMHGPKVTAKLGDLAATDARVARMVDFLDEGTSNPMGAAIVAVFPLVMQLVRNHEPVLEPVQRGFRVPFAKDKNGVPRRVQLKWKIGIKLGRLRNFTNDPESLEAFVFDNPQVKEMLAKQDINVARSTARRRRTQRNDAE